MICVCYLTSPLNVRRTSDNNASNVVMMQETPTTVVIVGTGQSVSIHLTIRMTKLMMSTMIDPELAP